MEEQSKNRFVRCATKSIYSNCFQQSKSFWLKCLDTFSSEGESSEKESGESGNESTDDSEEEEAHKNKGVQGLIEIENPNRIVKKTAEKVSKLDLSAASSSKPELSRREREELEKQRSQAHYQKLHAEGKTEQARADLARLAIIKQHRAEAAARREVEKRGKFIDDGSLK